MLTGNGKGVMVEVRPGKAENSPELDSSHVRKNKGSKNRIGSPPGFYTELNMFGVESCFHHQHWGTGKRRFGRLG